MSTILRRPLFRKGGQAGGITTGLGRERHANGDVAGKVRNYLNLVDTFAPSGGGSFNDLLMNVGLNLVSNPPSGNILQTLATETKGPFQQFQRAKAQESAGRRDLVANFLKTLSDDERIALEEQIDYLVEEFNISREEALNRLKPTFRKDQSPEETEREQLETQVAILTRPVSQGGQGWTYEAAVQIADAIGKKPKDKQYDVQNYAIEEDDVKTGDVDDTTGVITIAAPEGDYLDGFTYYNYIKDKWYTFNNGRFIPVE